MYILHITPSYLPATIYGGPTLSVSRLCEAQVQAGARVRVLTTTANGPSELEVPTAQAQTVNGVEVFYFPRLTKDHTHFSPKLLVQVWKQCRKFDVVHIHSWWNLVAVFSFLICRIRSVRPVLSPRGMLSPYTLRSKAKRIVIRLMRRIMIAGSVLHATTRQEAEECQVLLPGWRFFVAPNIVPLPLFSPSPREPGGGAGLKLLFLSRIDPKKGLELLFEALGKVSFPVELKIAGDGEKGYVEGLKRLGERINWLGWVEGEEKFRLLAEADVLVLTSYNENFANVVLESLAVGTPVLLSEQVGLSDYVREHGLGWVTSLDIDSIAAALETAWAAGEERSRIRAQAPGRIREDFEAVQVAKRYLEVYGALSIR